MTRLPLKKLFWPALLVLLFAISRTYIILNPPADYSDVTFYYERYANAWRYGLPPYTKYFYEYPPATVPLLSWPLSLDQAGYGKYYLNYRLITLVIDALLFAAMLYTFERLPWKKRLGYEALIWYILVSTLAKNFWYEGIDLAFTAAMTASMLSLLWVDSKTIIGKVSTWTFFWLSTAIKFLTAPFALPLAMITRSDWKRDAAAVIIGFFIVWGYPLYLYRSSLQVSFVYNWARPIKYASFPAHLIRWVDTFTNSETQLMEPPDFPYQGPVSDTVTQIDSIVFPAALAAIMFWAGWLMLKTKYPRSKQLLSPETITKELLKPKDLFQKDRLYYALKVYGVYVFGLFLTAKIFSQPFHIWYLPLLALFPFNSRKQWLAAAAMATLLVTLDITEFLHISNDWMIGPVHVNLIRDSFRFIPMGILLWMFMNADMAKTRSSL